MSTKSDRKLTKRTIDALAATGKDAVHWDRDLQGFGVRVYSTGRKVFVVQTRGPQGPKRVTLGRCGQLLADDARKQAAEAIDRIKRGLEPFPEPVEPELTVAGLAERYMQGHVAVNCRKRTQVNYRYVIEAHILPELGELSISEVDRSRVAKFHYGLRETPQAANNAVRILSRMFSMAEAWELAPPGRNPCRAVRRYREVRRERFLTPGEYREVGRVLKEAEANGSVSPPAAAALRLLMLTGCRKNEIVRLRWDDVDRVARELRLSETKTGPRSVPLTPAVEAVLDRIPRNGDNPWVIAGKKGGAHMVNVDAVWIRLRAKAGLEDVRIHDLRHSWASRALALGESLSMIGKLMGHGQVATTARYAHLARDTEKASAAKVGGSIGADILGPDADAA
ncbi:MAG: tyrosine-type recombinase/integrase [Deltaproteobacteria bacterium]|nr:tyrosine-type recombinase/integrase [Deltaproteobacteria bacterium]